MTSSRSLILGLYAVLAVLMYVVFVTGEDGLKACQLTHSFEECMHALR